MNAKTIALSALALLGSAALLPAQDLDGDVVRNPDDTVTYTIDLDGPPRSQAFVLVGLQPVWPHLPTPFGPLMIDPNGLLNLGSVPIDAFGHGTWSMTVPAAAATAGSPLRFQSLVMSPFGGLQFSYRDLVLQHGAAGNNFGAGGPARPNFAMAQNGNDQTPAVSARFKVGGQPGATYVVTAFDAQGNTVATRRIQLDRNGQAPAVGFDEAAGVERGHSWVVAEDIGQGHVLPMWRGTFR